jgi:hypothetical protein
MLKRYAARVAGVIALCVAGGFSAVSIASGSTASSSDTVTTTQVTTAVTTTAATTTVNSTTTVVTQRKVALCHKTHSRKHPYVTIFVSQSAVRGHLRHGDALTGCTTRVVKSLKARDVRVAKAKAKAKAKARAHHGKSHK